MVVLCAQFTIDRSFIFCFVQHFSKFCHGSASNVFKFLLVESIAAEFKLVAEKIVTPLGLATQTLHFSAMKFFLQQSRWSFIKFFVFGRAGAGKGNAESFCSKPIKTIFTTWKLSLLSFRLSQTIRHFFSASAEYSVAVSNYIPYLLGSRNFVKKRF